MRQSHAAGQISTTRNKKFQPKFGHPPRDPQDTPIPTSAAVLFQTDLVSFSDLKFLDGLHEIPPTGDERDCSAPRRYVDVIDNGPALDLVKMSALEIGGDVYGAGQQNSKADNRHCGVIPQILYLEYFTEIHFH